MVNGNRTLRGHVQRVITTSRAIATLLASSAPTGLDLQADTPEFISTRDQIVATYQHAIDALNRGEADAALQMDTDDWNSVVACQPRVPNRNWPPSSRRYIDSMKTPPEWKAVWLRFFASLGTLTKNPSLAKNIVSGWVPTSAIAGHKPRPDGNGASTKS
jgi:hypothetical protein